MAMHRGNGYALRACHVMMMMNYGDDSDNVAAADEDDLHFALGSPVRFRTSGSNSSMYFSPVQ